MCGRETDVLTFDEVSDLGLYWSFLQVLDHHVGNSGQVTHVAPPGAAVGPDVRGGDAQIKSVQKKKKKHF